MREIRVQVPLPALPDSFPPLEDTRSEVAALFAQKLDKFILGEVRRQIEGTPGPEPRGVFR